MIQNFPDLPKSSADEVSSLLSFCRSLVFKNSAEAEAAETLRSSKSAYDLVSAVLGLAPFDSSGDPDGSRAGSVVGSYVEMNEYYVEYLTRLGLREEGTLETTSQERMVTAVVKARTAEDHEIIHYPESFNKTIRNLFLEHFGKSLHYYNAVLHNEGLARYQRYWNYVNFVVTLMTLERMITARMDLAFDIDTFDERSMRNMFASYGLDFFESVPDKYRKRILKNINYLLANKGTTRALVSIMQIFGFEDITLFKYYLVKDLAREPGGSVSFPPSPELRFAQVEHDEENLEAAFLDPATKWESFESVTGSDPYWHAVEEEVAAQDFTYVNTKYLGIDVSIDMLKSTLNHAYFYSYLYEFKKAGDVSLPGIPRMVVESSAISSEPVHILDLMVALHSLTMQIAGWEDVVVKDYYQVAYAFATASANRHCYQEDDQAPWDVTLDASTDEERAAAFVANVENLLGVDWDDVDVETLQDDVRAYLEASHGRSDLTPGTDVLYDASDLDGKETTPYDLVRTYQENLSYASKLRQLMIDETDRRRYAVLRDIYGYKFIANFYTELFNGYDTYSEWLRAESPGLYDFVSGQDQTDALYDIITLVENFIEECDVAVEEFGGDTGLTDGEMSVTNAIELFSLTRTFIKMMIDTFKAYTTQLREFSVYYVYRDPFDEAVKLFEELTLAVTGGMFGTDLARVTDLAHATEGGLPTPAWDVRFDLSEEYDVLDAFSIDKEGNPEDDLYSLTDEEEEPLFSVRMAFTAPLGSLEDFSLVSLVRMGGPRWREAASVLDATFPSVSVTHGEGRIGLYDWPEQPISVVDLWDCRQVWTDEIEEPEDSHEVSSSRLGRGIEYDPLTGYPVLGGIWREVARVRNSVLASVTRDEAGNPVDLEISPIRG